MADALIFGATSMVGAHFVAHGRSACAAAGRRDPRVEGLRVERFADVDLTDLEAVRRAVRSAREPVVVNFAGATDVDAVERERPALSEPPTGVAWTTNALAPGVIADAARASDKFFVQISTDFVFDGVSGPYDEAAERSSYSPRVGWYGWTKSEGERRAIEADPTTAVVRIAYPYRGPFPPKADFARRLLARYREGSMWPMYTDQVITPTWIPDITTALDRLIAARVSGVVHVASPEPTTPFEFASELLSVYARRPVEVSSGRLAEAPTGGGHAPRPLRGGLVPARARTLGLPLTSWRSGIAQLVAEVRA